MGQFNSDLLGPTEVETWDTLMGAQDPSWNQPAPQPYVEPAADPMYAPAQELSYQQPYTAPEVGYGPDSPIYAPAEPAYGGPAEASYIDPFMQGASDPMYAPAPELSYADPFVQAGGFEPAPMPDQTPAWAPFEEQQSYISQPDFYAGTEGELGNWLRDARAGHAAMGEGELGLTGPYEPTAEEPWGGPVSEYDIMLRALQTGKDIDTARQIAQSHLTAHSGALNGGPDPYPGEPWKNQDAVDHFSAYLNALAMKTQGQGLPEYFGWNGTGGTEQPFFNNPQFAESNAQFDYTTNPQNREGVGILGGLENLAGAYGADIPGWSDFARNTVIPTLAASQSAQNPLTWFDNPVGNFLEKGNKAGAEAFVPVSLGDVALTALPGVGLFDDAGKTALRGYGQNFDTLGKVAGKIDELPLEAARGALTRASENPAFAPDVAELVARRSVGPTLGGAADDASKFLDEVIQSNPGRIASGIQAARAAGIPDAQIIETLSTNANAARGVTDPVGEAARSFIRSQAEEVPVKPITDLKGAIGDAIQGATRQTPGMEQIPDDVAAAIQRGANAGKAATAADELGQVVEGPGEEALQAALKRAEKMPLDSQTLLGVSELSDESKGLVAEHIRNAKALTEGVTQDVSRLRRTATRITGNLDNRVASEVAQQENNLYRQVINAEARLVDEFNRAASKVVTEGMSEADAIEAEALKMAHVESVFRKAKEATEVLRRSIEETLDTAGKLKFREAMKAYDAERMRAEQSLWKKIADAQQPLKELVLGGDISTVFQQGLRGARVIR